MSVIQQPVKIQEEKNMKTKNSNYKKNKKRKEEKNKKKLKRREEKKRITKRKDPKTIEKRKNQKMRAHRDMIVTQKILLGGSAKLRWASVVQWKEKTLEVDGASSIYFIYFFGCRIRNSEAATSGGGAQRPVRSFLKPKKTGARAAKTH